MPVYAHCPNCGLDFVSRGIAIDGATELFISDVGETCPRCGNVARLMEGRFNIVDNRVDVLAGPRWTTALVGRMTPAQAHRLRTGVTWAQQRLAEEPDDEELVKAKVDALVEREAPWLKGFLDKVFSERTDRVLAMLGFILVLLTFLGFAPGEGATQPPANPGITEEELRHLFDEYVGPEKESDTPTPAPPAPEEPTQESPPTMLA